MSVVVIDTIEPKNNGIFPVVKQWHVLGGRGRIVIDIAARDAIPAGHREIGMEVKVLDAPGEKTYKLDGGITNGDWVETSGDFISNSELNQPNGVPQLDAEGFINPAQIRNLFINDSYVVADEAARLALTTYTGNVVVQEDTGEVWFKRNNDNPADAGDFYLLSTAGAVVSVNGQTGVVSITIANLLAVGANLTEFNNAVAASPHATSVNASLSAINTELDALQIQIDNLSALDPSKWKGLYDPAKTYNAGEYIEGLSDGLFYRVIGTTTGNAPPNVTYYVRAGNYYSTTEIGTLLGSKANTDDVLTKTNTAQYTPSGNYHPATVKFVTDLIASTGIAQNNYTATTDPTVDNDVTEGYTVGSEWYNTITQVKFFCTNPADGAAVWVSQEAPAVLSLFRTKASHGFVVKNVLTLNGSGVPVKVSDPVSNKFVGIVTSVLTVNTFIIALQGYVTGLSGLTAGSIHYGQADGTLSTVESEMPILLADTTTSGYILSSGGGGGGGGMAIADTYATIATLLSDQANQDEDKWYLVQDASTDPTVDTGWAIYQYLGTTDGDLGDYLKIAEQESLDVVINNASEAAKGIVEKATDTEVLTGQSTGGTGALLFFTPQQLLAKLAINREVTAATGATVQTDNQGKIYFNRATAINFTIDELEEGSEITFINIGAGQVNFVNGAGVTLVGVASLSGASGGEFPAAQIFYKNPTAPMIISGGGGSVETVTGSLVDNTDPDNPVINNPAIADVTGLVTELARIENLIGNSEL